MDRVETGAKIAAIATALVAIAVFGWSINLALENSHNKRIISWQKAAIHKILQQDEDNILSLKDLLEKLGSVAWGSLGADVYIDKSDFTEGKVRVLLLEMISMETVYQMPNDNYALRFDETISDDEENIMNIIEEIAKTNLEITQQLIEGDRKFVSAMEEIRKYPNTYTKDTLYEEFFGKSGITRAQFEIFFRKYLHMIKVKHDDQDGAAKLSLR